MVQYSPEEHMWAPLEVAEVHQLLMPSGLRWWLSGGKAIDHWLGRQTREHGDTDVSTVRSDWLRLIEYLPEHLEAHAAIAGNLLPIDLWLTGPSLHNIWIRDTRTDRYVLQVNIEEGSDTWRYRRDPRIWVSWDSAIHNVGSIPTGSPATQLLWKSRNPIAKDNADLASVLPGLPENERTWLLRSIRLAHPESPWLSDIRLATR